MKTKILKFVALFVCFLAFSSAVQASTIWVTPYFTFVIRDNPPTPSTYVVTYYIENSDYVTTPTYSVGTYFSPGEYTFQSSYSIQVTEPANPPLPVNCYRIIVIVERNGTTTQEGQSEWTTAAHLQDNSQTIIIYF